MQTLGAIYLRKNVFIFTLKNLVLPRNAGSSMGQAGPALRESEIDGSARINQPE